MASNNNKNLNELLNMVSTSAAVSEKKKKSSHVSKFLKVKTRVMFPRLRFPAVAAVDT